MATVVGKTSSRIDELLAKLVTNAEIIDGNLLLINRDGTRTNIGGVGGSTSVTRIFYTSGVYPPRPIGALCVEWIGPIQPGDMTTKDTWVNTA